VKTNYAAKAQHESHDGPKQIGAGIFQSVVLRPVAPDFPPVAFDGESRPIAIEKAKILFAGEYTDS
jgi:hypothetical protein